MRTDTPGLIVARLVGLVAAGTVVVVIVVVVVVVVVVVAAALLPPFQLPSRASLSYSLI